MERITTFTAVVTSDNCGDYRLPAIQNILAQSRHATPVVELGPGSMDDPHALLNEHYQAART